MIKTDFSKVERLVLVYPLNILEAGYDYRVLVPFYDQLIVLVPEEIRITVFVKSEEIGQRIKDLRENLDYVVLKGHSTIWLRDTAGFNCGDVIVKPIFKPEYYKGAWGQAEKIDRNMQVVADVLSKRLERLPLVWDCGNLVTNGKIGFITRRLFEDNPSFTEDEVADMIRGHLGIEPVFLHEPPKDPLAHTDGYVAFVKENTALVSSYPDHWDENDRKYVADISRELVSRGIKVMTIYDNPENKYYYGTGKSGIPSARGIYVNFLQLNNTFIVPEYSFAFSGNPLDYNSRNRMALGKFGNVIPINCDRLAEFGGVLHCISFTD
jgi:agmatine/peptidylarginine deiminase